MFFYNDYICKYQNISETTCFLTVNIFIMKKNLFFVLIASICFGLAGCSDKKADTSDLKMYELTGNVKSVKVMSETNGIEELAYTLAFDEKGVATAHRYDKLWEGELNINVERNEKGEMTSYIAMYADAEIAEVDAKYTYDKNGYLTTIEAMWYGESSSTEKIKYDEKNNRNESVTEYYDYDMTIVDEVKYIYNNFDEKGNWIEREAVKRNYTKDYEGEIIDETTTTSKERREIVYY